MTSEQLAASHDLSKDLERAGFPQRTTAFVWCNNETIGGDPVPNLRLRNNAMHIDCAAPTAEEVLGELPQTIVVDGDTLTLDVWQCDGLWMVGWTKYLNGTAQHEEQPGIEMKPLVTIAAEAYLWQAKRHHKEN